MQTTTSEIAQQRNGLLRSPSVTVARLILASYLRSGWMWGEFVLVLVCFAALYFPYMENTTYFNGTSNFSLGGLAILGPAIMVRQATGARTYLLLARLTSRSAYSRGLMLAAAVLRVPLYLLFLILVLLAHRLLDPTPTSLFWGAVGLLPNTIVIAVLTVGLCSPIATRLKRIFFLAWVALVLFSFKPLMTLPHWLEITLSVSQIPLWPIGQCFTMSASGTFDPLAFLGIAILAIYCVLIAWIAGHWLEKRELLLH